MQHVSRMCIVACVLSRHRARGFDIGFTAKLHTVSAAMMTSAMTCYASSPTTAALNAPYITMAWLRRRLPVTHISRQSRPRTQSHQR